jgi:hypothetical protein
MRNIILASTAIALSGCSWLGLGNGHHDYNNSGYNSHGSYGHHAPKVAPKSCNSQQCLSRWNLECAIGPSFNVCGTAIKGDKTHPENGDIINTVKMKDAYDTGYRAELGGSYALSPNRKITGNMFMEEANSAGALDWGTVGGQALTGALSDYRSYGAEIGVRQYFAPRRGLILNSIRPYVEAKLGAAHLDAVRIENSQLGGAAFSATDIPFYQNGWVGTAAGMVGVETPIARHATLALETGVRYTQSPKTDTSILGPGFSIAGYNNCGSRTSIPVMLRGRYRF